MKKVQIKKGLDIPIKGEATHTIIPGKRVKTVAILGDDYIGMKPTMLVNEGDSVVCGQLLFTDKKNEGIKFTAPGAGTIRAINRGEKRRFESLIIELAGDTSHRFLTDEQCASSTLTAQQIRETLIDSGLWTSFRTRPYGKVPAIDADPASLFITATESAPLSPPPEIIIDDDAENYQKGLAIVRQLLQCPIHYCTGSEELLPAEQHPEMEYTCFTGPHPSGLASTHIHFIDPVNEKKSVWHLGYQDIMSIGHLFSTGHLKTERIIAIAGPMAGKPSLIRTRVGASIADICREEVEDTNIRVISGSVLCGRVSNYLGRYHNQISMIENSDGRSFFNWAIPGANRFSFRPIFISALFKNRTFNLNSALWGGKRAIYPLGVYDEVMPLDIIATSLLKSMNNGDTDKSKDLGCLELIEEDLALCGFVCPGKNEFSHELRSILNSIERGD